MKFRFIGNPAADGEGPDAIDYRGYRFVKNGPFVEVEGEAALRCARNNHFEPESGVIIGTFTDVTDEQPKRNKGGRPRKVLAA